MQVSTNRLLSSRAILSAVVVLLTLGGAQQVQGQAYATASKKADISAFVGYTRAKPDYGPFDNNGIVLGADYTRYFGWWVAPSLEVRFEHNSGQIVNNNTFLGGLRLQGDLRRFHPYADFLIGNNSITYVKPVFPDYTHDNALTWSYGGGVDIDLVRHFQLKLDYQVESSNYGNNGGSQDFSLSPSKATLGVVYRIPFKPYK